MEGCCDRFAIETFPFNAVEHVPSQKTVSYIIHFIDGNFKESWLRKKSNYAMIEFQRFVYIHNFELENIDILSYSKAKHRI